jgi:hypothetical protein
MLGTILSLYNLYSTKNIYDMIYVELGDIFDGILKILSLLQHRS